MSNKKSRNPKDGGIKINFKGEKIIFYRISTPTFHADKTVAWISVQHVELQFDLRELF